MVIAEPYAGYNNTYKMKARKPKSKVEIYGHAYISTITNNDDASAFGTPSGRSWAVKFTPTSDIKATALMFFLRKLRSRPIINVEVQGDAGGLPDGKNKITGWIYEISDDDVKFRMAKLFGTFTFLAGVDYWIILRFDSRVAEIRWHGNNIAGAGRAYKDGSGNWTLESNKTLIFRVISNVWSENWVEIPEMIDNTINHTSAINESGSFRVKNKNGRYSYPQPMRDLFNKSNRCRIFHGIMVEGSTRWLQKCEMIIGKANESDYEIHVELDGLLKLAVMMPAPKRDYGGMSRREVVLDLLDMCGVLRGGWKLDQGHTLDDGLKLDTGPVRDPSLITDAGNLPNVYLPDDGDTVYDLLDEIRESVGYLLYIDNFGNPIFRKSRLPSVDFAGNENVLVWDEGNWDEKNWFSELATVTPDDTLLSSQILSRKINVIRTDDDIYNMVSAWNLRAGSGVTSLSIGVEEEIWNEKGQLGVNTRKIEKTIGFPKSPMVNVWWENIRPDTKARERFRNIGSSSTQGKIKFEIYNKTFGTSNAYYDITVYGSHVTNASDNTFLVEKVNQQSIEDFGIRATSLLENKAVDSKNQMNDMVDRILNYRSRDLEQFNALIRGYPVYELEDVLQVEHDDVDSEKFYKLRSIIEIWSAYPRSYTMDVFFEQLEIKDNMWKLDYGYKLDKAQVLDM